MDSTSLTFLAAQSDRGMGGLVTVRHVEADPSSDDSRWATAADAALPNVEHLVYDHDDFPQIYSCLADGAIAVDSPFRWARALARYRHIAEVVAAKGSTMHLAGHGGDELFGHSPVHLADLVREHPLRAIRHAFHQRALRRWSWANTAKALVDQRTLSDWLRDEAAHLAEPLPPSTTPQGPWSYPVRMPPWAAGDAIHAVRRAMRASTTEPLSPSRAIHATLHLVRACGQAVRQLNTLMSAYGVEYAAPFLDDQVIESVLAVRPEERISPTRYKPLLSGAMRGIVPEQIFGRVTKGDFTRDVYLGLDRHRGDLLDLIQGSLLVERGLVDAPAWRRAVLAPHPHYASVIPLEQTVACELWLRAIVATGGPS